MHRQIGRVMAKRSMPRVANLPDVHFEGPRIDWTLCGILHTGFPHTRAPVTCSRCLELHRWVNNHRRERTDDEPANLD